MFPSRDRQEAGFDAFFRQRCMRCHTTSSNRTEQSRIVVAKLKTASRCGR